ncbi:unnamed protein product [Gordionus sp. m RMFG-2023]
MHFDDLYTNYIILYILIYLDTKVLCTDVYVKQQINETTREYDNNIKQNFIQGLEIPLHLNIKFIILKPTETNGTNSPKTNLDTIYSHGATIDEDAYTKHSFCCHYVNDFIVLVKNHKLKIIMHPIEEVKDSFNISNISIDHASLFKSPHKVNNCQTNNISKFGDTNKINIMERKWPWEITRISIGVIGIFISCSCNLIFVRGSLGLKGKKGVNNNKVLLVSLGLTNLLMAIVIPLLTVIFYTHLASFGFRLNHLESELLQESVHNDYRNNPDLKIKTSFRENILINFYHFDVLLKLNKGQVKIADIIASKYNNGDKTISSCAIDSSRMNDSLINMTDPFHNSKNMHFCKCGPRSSYLFPHNKTLQLETTILFLNASSLVLAIDPPEKYYDWKLNKLTRKRNVFNEEIEYKNNTSLDIIINDNFKVISNKGDTITIDNQKSELKKNKMSIDEVMYRISDITIICRTQLVIFLILLSVSLHTIALLALDRFLFIFQAIRYHSIMTRFTNFTILISIWIINIIIASVPFYQKHNKLIPPSDLLANLKKDHPTLTSMIIPSEQINKESSLSPCYCCFLSCDSLWESRESIKDIIYSLDAVKLAYLNSQTPWLSILFLKIYIGIGLTIPLIIMLVTNFYVLRASHKQRSKIRALSNTLFPPELTRYNFNPRTTNTGALDNLNSNVRSNLSNQTLQSTFATIKHRLSSLTAEKIISQIIHATVGKTNNQGKNSVQKDFLLKGKPKKIIAAMMITNVTWIPIYVMIFLLKPYYFDLLNNLYEPHPIVSYNKNFSNDENSIFEVDDNYEIYSKLYSTLCSNSNTSYKKFNLTESSTNNFSRSSCLIDAFLGARSLFINPKFPNNQRDLILKVVVNNYSNNKKHNVSSTKAIIFFLYCWGCFGQGILNLTAQYMMSRNFASVIRKKVIFPLLINVLRVIEIVVYGAIYIPILSCLVIILRLVNKTCKPIVNNSVDGTSIENNGDDINSRNKLLINKILQNCTALLLKFKNRCKILLASLKEGGSPIDQLELEHEEIYRNESGLDSRWGGLPFHMNISQNFMALSSSRENDFRSRKKINFMKLNPNSTKSLKKNEKLKPKYNAKNDENNSVISDIGGKVWLNKSFIPKDVTNKYNSNLSTTSIISSMGIPIFHINKHLDKSVRSLM